MNETKPWYKSKITLAGILTGFVLLSDYFTHWISGQVTPDQIAVIQTAAPAAADAVTNAVKSHNVIEALSGVASFVVAIWRVWFTDSKIAA